MSLLLYFGLVFSCEVLCFVLSVYSLLYSVEVNTFKLVSLAICWNVFWFIFDALCK